MLLTCKRRSRRVLDRWHHITAKTDLDTQMWWVILLSGQELNGYATFYVSDKTTHIKRLISQMLQRLWSDFRIIPSPHTVSVLHQFRWLLLSMVPPAVYAINVPFLSQLSLFIPKLWLYANSLRGAGKLYEHLHKCKWAALLCFYLSRFSSNAVLLSVRVVVFQTQSALKHFSSLFQAVADTTITCMSSVFAWCHLLHLSLSLSSLIFSPCFSSREHSVGLSSLFSFPGFFFALLAS